MFYRDVNVPSFERTEALRNGENASTNFTRVTQSGASLGLTLRKAMAFIKQRSGSVVLRQSVCFTLWECSTILYQEYWDILPRLLPRGSRFQIRRTRRSSPQLRPLQQALQHLLYLPLLLLPPLLPLHPAETVDVTAILDDMAARNSEKLDWKKSIVDLMKLVDMDSSLSARKQLATELHYPGDQNDSATMNVWLHKQVLRQLSEHGGKIPRELL
jgi:hypothetical protein